MDAELLARLAELVTADPTLAGRDFVAVTYVVRFGTGWANEMVFGYNADGTCDHGALDGWDALDLVEGAHTAATTPWRVFTLQIVPSADSVELRLYYGEDADAWFVQLGREDELSELARPGRSTAPAEQSGAPRTAPLNQG